MSTKPNCKHEAFHGNFDVKFVSDIQKWMVDVTISCTECEEPFRFLGVPPGVSFERPMVSIDGLELHLPIEPQGEPILFKSAVLEMPKKESKQ